MTRTAAEEDLRLRICTSLDDPALAAVQWDGLVAEGTDVVFLTRAWQHLWWGAVAKGPPLIVLAERAGRPFAIAPLCVAHGTLLLAGSGNADYLDFIGRPGEDALVAMLETARAEVSGFCGIELYHLPSHSPTCAMLPAVASRLGLELECEHEMGAPYADLTDADVVARVTSRRSVRKEEARMRRAAPFAVRSAESSELDGLMDLFFRQHAARWEAAGEVSFNHARSRRIVRDVVHSGVREGWAQVTVLEWRGEAALDIGLIHGTTQMSWLVSRDPAIEGFSPGRVLAAHVARAAVERGIRRLDFGLGEEDYKLREASGVARVESWTMYP
jgi:CelD/BcsL family acetyltransferase involved in cellulose biosynthesis